VPYIYAYAIVNGDTIKSGLVDILISSGFADPFRFSVSAKSINFPGMQMDGLEDVIRVQPFDRFGNPVPENTPVWFYCTHGGVQTENAYTDINGIIQQKHYSGGTRPIAPNNTPGFSDGFMFVKARTMGESGLDIWDSVKVLWTGSPVSPFTWTVSYTDTNGVTTNLSGPNTPTIPHLGSGGIWHFQIRDFWNNPLSAGTTITVEGGEAVKTVGDVSINLPDTQVGANGVTAFGITDFTVGVNDTHSATELPEARSYILKVKVVHPVYGESGFILASGTVL
jgi:hypothetical protein